jgi:phenylacetic acid degradation operon negative regulatory protein
MANSAKNVSGSSRPRPASLILSLYGSGMRHGIGPWLPVAAIVTLMDELGFDSQAVRSALSRMKRRGLLEARDEQGRRGYELSADAGRILREGDGRIFGQREPADLAEGWILAVFSIPESERGKRHVLRSRLSYLGFGSQAPGVLIAPVRLADDAERVIDRYGLSQYVRLFRAHPNGSPDATELVRQCWDLPRLAKRYDEYVERHEATAARWAGVRSPSGSEAFADYIYAVHEWRKFPYLDPGLPGSVLPDPWSGHRAAELFVALREQLEGAAMSFMGSVVKASAGSVRPGRRSAKGSKAAPKRVMSGR